MIFSICHLFILQRKVFKRGSFVVQICYLKTTDFSCTAINYHFFVINAWLYNHKYVHTDQCICMFLTSYTTNELMKIKTIRNDKVLCFHHTKAHILSVTMETELENPITLTELARPKPDSSQGNW